MHIEPALGAAILWAVFVGTHIGLTTRGIRTALVARLGERGFLAVFSVVASVSFAVAVRYYAAHRLDGAPGLALGTVPVARALLIVAIAFGIVLMTAGSVTYPGSPYDLFTHRMRPPRGIERVTRHPFFSGVALLALAHALLATRLVGTVAFSGLAILAVAGAMHQDRKLLARAGSAYAAYLAATSAVPFAAILAGRQRLVVRELSTAALVLGALAALALRTVHASIFAHGGVWVIVAVVGGAGVITWQSGRRAERVAPAPTPAPVRS